MKSFINLTLLLCSVVVVLPAFAQTLTLEQVVQKVVDHYPSLKIAAIQVERARQESRKAESQLGWQLGAQAGINREVGLLGTPTDTTNVNASLSRQLESGTTLGFEGGVRKEDSEAVFSPLIPNPSTTTNLELSLRQPLAQGSGNPAYEETLASAEAGVQISLAERQLVYDQLAAQIIELYMAAATTQARIDNLERAVQRTQRLKNYINNRAGLGLSEEKDILQVNAQLDSRQAELRGLEVLWQQQRISLNRLMGRDWSAELKPVRQDSVTKPDEGFQALYNTVIQHSAEIKRINGRIDQADSAIRLRRDAREDNIDLILSIGNQNRSGDTVSGDVDQSEVVGGINLEYQHGFNKQAEDAELYQAQLDRSAALQDKRLTMEDLHYDVSSLLAEISAGIDALTAYRSSVNSEQKKLQEAQQRYRNGRTDTDQLIQFEAALAEAELSLELQRIELTRRTHSLDLLTGSLWKDIILPNYDSDLIQPRGDRP